MIILALAGAVFTGAPASAQVNVYRMSCASGQLTVSAERPWHVVTDAPWRWDQGERLSINDSAVRYKGKACTGSVKAYFANGKEVKTFSISVF